jgi:hypothetical protein
MRFLPEPFLVPPTGFSVDRSRASCFPFRMESDSMLLEVAKIALYEKPVSPSSTEGALQDTVCMASPVYVPVSADWVPPQNFATC